MAAERHAEEHPDDVALLDVLAGRQDAAAGAHAGACPRCTARLRLWREVRTAVRATAPMPVALPASVLAGALTRLDAVPAAEPVRAHRGLGWGWQLLRAQVPLVTRSLAAATALMLLLGVIVVRGSGAGRGGEALSLLAPLAAALGLALIHGREVDPPLEITAALGTSVRTVLLARLVLVCGYDLLLGMAVTGVTVAASAASGGFGTLVGEWLGPMFLLASLSLLVAVCTRPAIGIGVALALWALRVLADIRLTGVAGDRLGAARLQAIRAVWSTTLPILVVAAVLLALAIVVAPRRLRFAA